MSYRLQTQCRACQGKELIPVFDLGLQPLANEFRKAEESRSGFFPLSVVLCPQCTLSQLSVVVDPETLYRHYQYVTSSSETMRRHFDRLFKDLESEIEGTKTIVEIGSNDGLLLEFAKKRGYRVTGIEPAENLANIAHDQRGVRTIESFFHSESAEEAMTGFGHPSIILARHCFAHADNWREWIAALEVLADKRSIIAIEIPYVHDLLSKIELDTVYHEHTSYVSLNAIFYLLRGTPFNIHRVIRYGVHGGALLVMLRHADSKVEPHLSADEYMGEDKVTVEHWKKFSDTAKERIGILQSAVRNYVAQGERVCGFGASAKGTVWVNACGFTEKDLLFVSDNSPYKPGNLIPGTRIPVIPQEEFLSEHPNRAVCFAWNFKEEILKSQSKWRDRGGKFIFPIE